MRRYTPNTDFGSFDCGRQAIDIVAGVVQVEAGSGCGDCAEAFHQWLVAVVAGPDGDVVLVEERSHVVRVNSVDVEREDAALLRAIGRTEDAQVRNRAQRVDRIADQFDFVGVDCLESDIGQVAGSGGESDGVGDCGGARLKARGHIGIGRAVDLDLADHAATAHERWHGLEQIQLAVEHAGSEWADHLVPAECEEIDIEVADIQRQDAVRSGLRRLLRSRRRYGPLRSWRGHR